MPEEVEEITRAADLPQMTPLEVGQTCALINQYLRETDSMTEIAAKLGWTIRALTEFRRDYASLLNYDQTLAYKSTEYVNTPGPVLPPAQSELIIGPDPSDIQGKAATDEEIAQAVERADQNMIQGLQAMGLTATEADEFKALQEFNRAHFRTSMEAVSSNGMRTSIRLGTQQKIVEGRLALVRSEIASFGGIQSDDRDKWLREERMLMSQLLDIGELINRIQETWFKGTAVLAVANMRARDRELKGPNFGSITQRSNKPAFSVQ